MTIDPSLQATSLIASSLEITPIERQNRYGLRYLTITGLESGKHVTVLAIQTPGPFSSEQFFEILDFLSGSYGVESIQTAFAAVIPNFGNDYRNDLHLSAHLRAEATGNIES